MRDNKSFIRQPSLFVLLLCHQQMVGQNPVNSHLPKNGFDASLSPKADWRDHEPVIFPDDQLFIAAKVRQTPRRHNGMVVAFYPAEGSGHFFPERMWGGENQDPPWAKETNGFIEHVPWRQEMFNYRSRDDDIECPTFYEGELLNVSADQGDIPGCVPAEEKKGQGIIDAQTPSRWISAFDVSKHFSFSGSQVDNGLSRGRVAANGPKHFLGSPFQPVSEIGPFFPG
ncbi:MAG TPA: hypothetical protein VMW46_13945 [Candidatus Desulfaltia sp.]|nr:hypothetical protein [Candidatus Desulfaltia sp.]